MNVRMRRSCGWSLALAFTALMWIATAGAPAVAQEPGGNDVEIDFKQTSAKCLQRVGEPWENGDYVYIKVKNTCSKRVGFRYEMQAHKYGIHGRSASGSPKKGKKAIGPGKTTTVCVRKPTAKGRYCFRFCIRNFDQKNHPTDVFYRWLNNITIAYLPGTGGTGDFEVGGSELIGHDVALAVATPLPAGWNFGLSHALVTADSFPATVEYFLEVPAEAEFGETIAVTVEGTHPDTGELVGTATITVTVGDSDAVAVGVAGATSERSDPGSVSDEGPSERFFDEVEPPVDVEPPGEGEPPQPNFVWQGEEEGRPIVGRAILLAWDQARSAELADEPPLRFDLWTADGWVEIGSEQDRPVDRHLGLGLLAWDTDDLAAGDYLVRVTMTNEFGLSGSAERWLTVGKAPVTVASGSIDGYVVTFDASDSFDPDGSIVETTWDLGDGTVVTGPAVNHVYHSDTVTGEVPVNVTTVDDQGFETTSYCLADLEGNTFQCTVRSCGCAKMDVKRNGNSSTPMPWMPPGSVNDLGPYNDIPDPLPAGNPAGGYSLFANFEVIAELVPGSDPSKCDSGQWVKRTAYKAGRKYDKKQDGQTYPVDGDDMADDNYDPGNTNTNPGTPPAGGNPGTPPTITWTDGPGWGDPGAGRGGASGDDVRNGDANGLSYKAEFFAMVSGPLGTCQCSWTVDMKVDKTGKAVIPPKVSKPDCS